MPTTPLASSRAKAPGRPRQPRRSNERATAAPGPAGFLNQVQLGRPLKEVEPPPEAAGERSSKRLAARALPDSEVGTEREAAKKLRPSLQRHQPDSAAWSPLPDAISFFSSACGRWRLPSPRTSHLTSCNPPLPKLEARLSS